VQVTSPVTAKLPDIPDDGTKGTKM
jgi:hypothetical protein